MIRSLVLIGCLFAVAACKSESAKPSSQSAIKPRSGKIDLGDGVHRTPADGDGSAAASPSLPGEPGTTGERKDLGEQLRERRQRADTDGDGQISDQERIAVRAERTQRIYERLDADHDGKVSLAEARDSRWLKRVDDPAKLDPDGDGFVTVDELNKTLAERSERRHRLLDVAKPWGGGRSTPPPAPAK
ncbi:MAG: EF-hand domain-containing protein [Kofleriaceae bacterium]